MLSMPQMRRYSRQACWSVDVYL